MNKYYYVRVTCCRNTLCVRCLQLAQSLFQVSRSAQSFYRSLFVRSFWYDIAITALNCCISVTHMHTTDRCMIVRSDASSDSVDWLESE